MHFALLTETDMNVIKQLERTVKSINAHLSRGGTMQSKRGYELLDRYNDLRQIAHGQNVWAGYCEAHQYDISHDGYDFFA